MRRLDFGKPHEKSDFVKTEPAIGNVFLDAPPLGLTEFRVYKGRNMRILHAVRSPVSPSAAL
jgi:hypothetical protein